MNPVNIKRLFFFLLISLPVLIFFNSCNDKQPEERIAQMLSYTSEGHIFIKPWPEGTPRKIAKGLEPSLSADGKYLAYSSNIMDKKRIKIYDLKNDNQWFIEDIHGAGYRPLWSPAENKILFTSLVLTNNIPHRMIVIYDPFTKKKDAIVMDETNLYSPVWGPDGQTILAHDKENLYEWDIKGKLKHTFPLKSIFGDYHYSEKSSFQPSSDKTQWLFKASVKENSEKAKENNRVFLFDSSLNQTRQITPEHFNTNSFCWGPDESSVLVTTTNSGQKKDGEYDEGPIIQISLEGEILAQTRQNGSNPYLYSFVLKNNKQ